MCKLQLYCSNSAMMMMMMMMMLRLWHITAVGCRYTEQQSAEAQDEPQLHAECDIHPYSISYVK